MSRQQDRAESARQKNRGYRPVGWAVNVMFVFSAAVILLFWLRHSRAAHIGWLNSYRAPVFNAALSVVAGLFLLMGLVPWDYLNRRSRERDRKQRQAPPPRRTSRKVW
jgi:hypothetical protein